MGMVIHKDFKDDDVHADVARTYADITARDADSTFNTATTNLNKNVRVESPLAIYKLMTTVPLFLELSQTTGVDANGVLTANFLLEGNGTNVLQRISSNGTDGIFLNGDNSALSFRAQSATNSHRFVLLDKDGNIIITLQSDSNLTPKLGSLLAAEDLTILASDNLSLGANTNTLFTAGGTFILQGGIGGEIVHTRLAGADQNPIVRFQNVGSNPGKTSFLVGNRNPQGLVTGVPANLYFQELGTQSAVYMHKGTSSSNNDWLELETSPQKANFAIDTTTNLLGADFQIYACTNTSVVRTITISNETIALGTTTSPHRFTIKDETSNAGIFPINILTESGLVDGNTMTSIETDDGALSFYTDGTNTFIESKSTNPRDAVVFTGNSFDVSSQATDPQSMVFSNDGRKVFILDRQTDTVYEYTLSISYDIGSTVTYTGNFFSVASQETSPVTISFNTDGTKMFMAGQINNALFEYSLSVGFDLSSTVAFTGNFKSMGTEDTSPTSVEWKADGTKFFMVGRSTNSVYEYTVSVAYDLSSTVTFTGNFFSVATQDAAPESVRFSPDGKRFFISATISNVVNEYSLTIPFSLASGVAFTGFFFDVTGQGTVAISVAFKPSGTKMYLLFAASAGEDKFFEYDVFPNFSME